MKEPVERRNLLRAGLAAVAIVAAGGGALGATPVAMTVYKDAGCGCCGAWIEHLRRAAAFKMTAVNRSNMADVKVRYGVPTALASCHTALVGRYVVEGHVPAADILRLLRTRPAGVIGLAVPGMPAGSPGMEVPGRSEPFATIAFGKDGQTSIFARHGSERS